MRRSPTNAPQRAGAAQRRVVMSRQCEKTVDSSRFSLAKRIERRHAEHVAATRMSGCTTAAFVAHHDAPPIGERAAARGRLAMEDGAERAGEPNSIRHWRFRTRISATLCDPRDRPRAKIR
jgi:hypothetical protein